MSEREWGMAAGELQLTLRKVPGGIALAGLVDRGIGRELLAPNSPPLFNLTLRALSGEEQCSLSSYQGWHETQIAPEPEGVTLTWAAPVDGPKGLSVRAHAAIDPAHHAWYWTFVVTPPGEGWSVWQVVFPQLALSKPGDDAVALVPAGSGQLKRDAWETAFRREAKYPGGWWWGLQFMAAYASVPAPTGLYLGLHDPQGSTKNLLMVGQPEDGALYLGFEHPAPDMGRAGNAFALSGQAVWQLLRGDWFDAAQIYKTWAREHAFWWPRLGAEGREDTPLWMRELSLWVSGGSGAGMGQQPITETVARVRAIREYMGLPLGFHWYCWHEIPFDNDYPHYFPARQGFVEGVRELQQAGVRVMPYINGRLWDTRDRGAEDFEFTRVALPASTKDEHGQPYVESYASLEADGSPVRLAPMCPTTHLWQTRVHELVERLFDECGVDGVYIDQVAAAEAKLCFDPAHGHPLGGGHWWHSGYWEMLDAIRATLPQGRMLTTECNSEGFVRWFDGYLTWHWQQDQMVPVFPAVYGGAIQLFGRNYGGTSGGEEPTQALAWRMRAGQQFVFGEQLGWFNLNLADERMPLDFIRQVARLRWRLRRYFYAGEMLRPPRLEGEIPTLRANWQWSESKDNPWVEMPALLTGAWRLPSEHRLVLLCVNVGDDLLEATLHVDARSAGLESATVRVTRLEEAEGPGEALSWPNPGEQTLRLAAHRAVAFELQE